MKNLEEELQNQHQNQKKGEPFDLQMSFLRKSFWYVFAFFILISFVGMPSYSLFKILQQGVLIEPIFIFLDYIFLPLVTMFNLLLWFPLITPNRKISIPITVILVVAVIATLNLIVPVKYFFPRVLLLFSAYTLFFFLFYKAILSIGEVMRDIMIKWWATYESPKNFYDLARNAQRNTLAGLKVDLLLSISKVPRIVLVFLIVFVTILNPTIWGVGLFEVKTSFPSEKAFQEAILERFFYKNDLLKNISIQQYSRNIPIAYSPCRLSTIGDSNLRYIDFSHEIIATEKKTGKPFAIAIVKDDYIPLSESPLLTKNVKSDVFVFSYSETYFRLVGYPSEYENSDKAHLLSIIKDEFIKDKNSRWFLKNDILLCAEVNTPQEEDKFIYILKLFKTDETNKPVQPEE